MQWARIARDHQRDPPGHGDELRQRVVEDGDSVMRLMAQVFREGFLSGACIDENPETLLSERRGHGCVAFNRPSLGAPAGSWVHKYRRLFSRRSQDLVRPRSEEHTSELQSRQYIVCR